jgi:aminoglycoside phosphotransferase (APT) family kinase protein
MEMMKGTRIDTAFLASLSEQKRLNIFTQAGDTLRQIHTPVNSNPAYYIDAHVSRALSNIAKNELLLQEVGINVQDVRRSVTGIVDNQHVAKAGVTRVHRDFYFNNLLYNPETDTLEVIDWELSGIGTPAEDWGHAYYAINHLFGGKEEKAFWYGYGGQPDKRTLEQFFIARAMKWLTKIDVEDYRRMEKHSFFPDVVEEVKSVIRSTNKPE